MGPVAVNRFTITRPLFYEGMLRVTKERLGPFMKKILIVLAVLWAALAAITFFTKSSPSYALVELVDLHDPALEFEPIHRVLFGVEPEAALAALRAVGIWLCVYIPRNQAKRAWKVMESKSGGELERVTSFFPDRLEIGSGGETVIPYADVLQMLDTEHLLILTCKEKVGVLLARNGFETGDIDAVRALIKRGMEGGAPAQIEAP